MLWDFSNAAVTALQSTVCRLDLINLSVTLSWMYAGWKPTENEGCETHLQSLLFPLILAVSEKRITTRHIIIQTSERHFLVSWSFCVLYHHWFTTHLSSFTKHFWLWSWRLFSRQPEMLQDIYPALLILSLLVGMPIFKSLSLCEISIF